MKSYLKQLGENSDLPMASYVEHIDNLKYSPSNRMDNFIAERKMQGETNKLFQLKETLDFKQTIVGYEDLIDENLQKMPPLDA